MCNHTAHPVKHGCALFVMLTRHGRALLHKSCNATHDVCCSCAGRYASKAPGKRAYFAEAKLRDMKQKEYHFVWIFINVLSNRARLNIPELARPQQKIALLHVL
jgi:hypothetical protein